MMMHVYKVKEDYFLDHEDAVDMPPRGVARMAVVLGYVPEGGRVVEKGDDVLKIYDKTGNLKKVIVGELLHVQ